MFSTSDTIVAIATPAGRGGIGIVRLSGPGAPAIACRLTQRSDELEPRRATLTRVRLPVSTAPQINTAIPALAGGGRSSVLPVSRPDPIDHVVATYFPGPRSYTGDEVVELSAHGSPVILRAIVAAAVSLGARLAEPGEFTLRAFLNGRIDLMQAEAVADLINAVTPLQARAAFDQLQGTLTRTIGEIERTLFDLVARLEASIDFPEEGYHFVDPAALAQSIDALIARTAALLADADRGRLVREGLQVTIVGKPNVGKSSLFNALVGTARAIVTDVPGTTRDLLTEIVDVDGLRVTLVDTAGLRETADAVELEGVDRARQAQTVSDLTLVVIDAAHPLDENDRSIIAQTRDSRTLVVANKSDLGHVWSEPEAVRVSARTQAGLDVLRQKLIETLDIEPIGESPAITNVRHISLVRRAQDGLVGARTAAQASLSEEFVLADLQEARVALEEITGRRTADDVLTHIFSKFCIGK